MGQPPPLPRRTSTDSFAHQAARASWIAPLVAIGINVVGQGALSTQQDQFKVWGSLIFGGIACLLILTGFVLGIIALCSMAKHGREGILGQALTGTLLCGLVILLGLAAIPAFKRAKARAEASRASMVKARESERALNQEVQKRLQGHSGPDQTGEKMQQFQKSLLDAAQNTSGDASLALRAESAYIQKLNTYKADYDSAVATLKDAKVLNAITVKDKSDLVARREVVRKFLDANTKVKDYIGHGAENFRAEFDNLHIPQNVTDEALAGYHKKADILNPLVVSVRETDEKIGQGMLGILDLEETNWGHWNVSEADGKIHFENAALRKDYNAFLNQIRESSTEQLQLQRKLLQVSKQVN